MLDLLPYMKEKNMHEFWYKMHDKYGDIFRVKVLSNEQVYVRNPDATENIVRFNEPNPVKDTSSFAILKEVNDTYGRPSQIVWNNSDEAMKLRKYGFNYMLQKDILKQYTPRIDAIAKDFVKYYKSIVQQNPSPSEEQMKDTSYKLSTEVIVAIVFGKRLNNLTKASPQAQTLYTTVNNLLETFGTAMYEFPWYKISPKLSTAYQKVDEYAKTVYDYVDALATDKTGEATGTTIINDGVPNIADYMERNKDQGFISTASSVVDMIEGGVDTTGNLMNFCFLELGKRPDIQTHLFEHICEVMGIDPTKPLPSQDEISITEDHLKKLDYLKNVVTEVLRFNPIAPGFPRVLKEDMDINGYLVPKGTNVIITVAATARSDKFFENSLVFDPNRHARGEKKYHPFAQLNFGMGSRACPGSRLALNEVYLALARFVLQFEWKSKDPTAEVKKESVFLTRPKILPGKELVFTIRK